MIWYGASAPQVLPLPLAITCNLPAGALKKARGTQETISPFLLPGNYLSILAETFRSPVKGTDCVVCPSTHSKSVVMQRKQWDYCQMLFVLGTPTPKCHGNRSLLIVLFLLNFRVVPHGTKGTGPKFITRPVYVSP